MPINLISVFIISYNDKFLDSDFKIIVFFLLAGLEKHELPVVGSYMSKI